MELAELENIELFPIFEQAFLILTIGAALWLIGKGVYIYWKHRSG